MFLRSEARMAELIEANLDTFELVAQHNSSVLEAIISITSGESCPLAAVLQRHMQCAEKLESDCVSIPQEGFYDCVWSTGVCQAHALALEQDLLNAYEFPEKVTMGFSRAQEECRALDDTSCRQLCSPKIIFEPQDSYSVKSTVVVPSSLLIISTYFLW